MDDWKKAHTLDCINIRIQLRNKNEEYWLSQVGKLLVAQHLGANIERKLNKLRKLIVENDAARADLLAIKKFVERDCYLPDED